MMNSLWTAQYYGIDFFFLRLVYRLLMTKEQEEEADGANRGVENNDAAKVSSYVVRKHS